MFSDEPLSDLAEHRWAAESLLQRPAALGYLCALSDPAGEAADRETGTRYAVFFAPGPPAAKLKDLIAREVDGIEEHLSWVRSDVRSFNDN